MRKKFVLTFVFGFLLGTITYGIGNLVFDQFFLNNRGIIATAKTGKYTVKISGETTGDNYCFVKYIDVYDMTQSNALSQMLPVQNFYSEHCPDTTKTPWVVVLEKEKSFKVLTGNMNGTTYDTYVLNNKTHRFELQTERSDLSVIK